MTEDKILQILQDIKDEISDMKADVAVNTRDVAEHMRRSLYLEEQVELLKQEVLKLRGFASVAGWIVGVAATVLTILDKLGKL